MFQQKVRREYAHSWAGHCRSRERGTWGHLGEEDAHTGHERLSSGFCAKWVLGFASSQTASCRMVSYGAVDKAVTGETGRASNRGRSPGLAVAAAALCAFAIVAATASWTQVSCVHDCVRPLRTAELPRQSQWSLGFVCVH